MKRKSSSSSSRRPSGKASVDATSACSSATAAAAPRSSTSKESPSSSASNPLTAGAYSANPEYAKRMRLLEETGLSVTLSLHDKSPEVNLSADRLTCWGATGCGYSMVRATHAVDNGKYYWECEILNPEEDPTFVSDGARTNVSHYLRGGGGHSHSSASETPHVRIGWALDSAALAAPVGYDKYGYGYRDLSGSKIHNSLREDSYGEAFGPGDVIGCFVYLDRADPRSNEIRFVRNGIDQGTAYRGPSIVSGMYFPAVSVYHHARVRVNFGPLFIYPLNSLTHQDSTGAQLYQGTLPLSELQPMNADLKKVHVDYVVQRRAFYREKAASVQ